ncbi:hypothetical protein EXA21_11205, partial [Vibrio cincinnatiensis]|uniref:cation transporting ATPase C-terminal domain-containing protein n=1 Tax=Vibrio cincinnatiensis TaxID=675 RepID=UPI001EDF59BB
LARSCNHTCSKSIQVRLRFGEIMRGSLRAQLAFLYLPMMNQLFHSAPISIAYWGVMIVYGGIVMVLVEVEKMLWRKYKYQRQ